MEMSLVMRSFVLVTLAFCLVTVAASAYELPLMPALDPVVESQSSQAPGSMSQLIGVYFGDQVVSLVKYCNLNFVMTCTVCLRIRRREFGTILVG